MTTTITREERERVAKLLGLEEDAWAWLIDGGRLVGQRSSPRRATEAEQDRGDFDRVCQMLLRVADIDRVAQALRDAAPQWREVTETEPALHTRVVVAWAGEAATAAPEVAFRTPLGGFMDSAGTVYHTPTHWMPLPAPPEAKPAPAPAPQAVAQPGASGAAGARKTEQEWWADLREAARWAAEISANAEGDASDEMIADLVLDEFVRLAKGSGTLVPRAHAARIEALERTVAELALAVERLTEKG